MKVDISNLRALVTDANGIQKVMTLQDLAQLKLMPDMRVIIIDAETGKPVEHVSVRKDGDDLVFEVKAEGEIARLEDYYIDSGFSTVDAVPEGAAGPEAGAAAAAGGGLFGGTELGTIGLLALGGVGAGALLASGGSGGGSSSTPPSFTLVEGVGGDAVDQLAMEVGDELVAERDGSGEITGFLLNGEPIGAETLAAIDRLGNGSEIGSFYDPISDTNYENYDGFYFDSLVVSSDGVFITRQAGEGTLGFNVDNKSDLSTLIKGDLFVEADSAYVKFGAEEDAASVYSELAAISVIADENADLELSNQGVENFMSSLRTIHIESNGDSDGTAQLQISASTNYDFNSKTGELAGDGFLDALQTITVLGSVHANASVSISHSGSDNFMASLKSIHVEATGENASADVSISASANQIEVDGEIAYLSGADFMPSLQSITVISEQYYASLSLSHSGGGNFMQSLRTIEIQGGNRTQISLSASANNTYNGDDSMTYFKESMNGDNFMQSLESIRMVVTTDNDNSLSISHSGSDYFMQSLKTIDMESVGDLSVSISASANGRFASGDGEGIQLLGEHFMASLETITLTSTGDTGGTASLSLSHSGGAFFMESLREIELTADGDVEVSISASANLFHVMDWYSEGVLNEDALELKGENFMASLQSITLLSDSDSASLSISHSGGDYFMASLQTINLQSEDRAQLSISASANRYDNDEDNAAPGDEVVIQLTGSFFMQSLETITLDSNASYASISISHDGSAFFMQSLLSMEVTTAQRAEISLSNSANYEDATGDNFMQSLDSILIASDGEGRASLSISNDGGDFFANALTEITVSSGALGTYRAVVDISNSTSDFATTGIDRDSDNFMTMLDTINVVSVGGAADVRLSNKEGENFLSALETVNLDGLYGNIDLAGPMGKTSGNLIFDVTDVDDLAFIQTHRADFDNAATTTLITEIGSSNLQYNAIFESGIGTLGNGFMATADDEVYVSIELPPVQGQSQSANVADITGGDYEGFGGIGIGTPSGWVSLGSNDIEDVFAYNDSDMGDAVIGGFDDGLDQFDFSALGALFSGTINDQSTATAHVGTDQGDILVTQSDDAAADAIIWLNTEGGTTTDFADFEASIYIVDGSAMTWDSNDMMFGA